MYSYSLANVYYDLANVKRNGDIVDYKIKSMFFNKYRSIGFKEPYYTSISHMHLNCSNYAWALQSMATFDKNDELIEKQTYRGDNFLKIPNPTAGSKSIIRLCNDQLKIIGADNGLLISNIPD